jgi:hypothetical protein
MQDDDSEGNRDGGICSGEVDVDVQLIDRSRSKRMWRCGSDSVGLGRGPVVWCEHSDQFSGCHKCRLLLWSDCSFLQKVKFRSLWWCCIKKVTDLLDIIHRPVFYFKTTFRRPDSASVIWCKAYSVGPNAQNYSLTLDTWTNTRNQIQHRPSVRVKANTSKFHIRETLHVWAWIM